MRLTVVGCSGSLPGPDSPASCYLLEAEHDDGSGPRTWRVVLDLGNGALGTLQRYADPRTLDAVLLSHLHPDHCQDLCGLYVLLRYHPEAPFGRLRVHGPRDTASRLAEAYGLDPDPGMSAELDVHAWAGPATIGPFEVEPVPVDHPVEAYGLRVRAGGRVLGYSGDTGPCAGLDRVAEGVDLLVAEAAFREGEDNPPSLHLTGADAGRAAAAGGSTRLLVTHVAPWHEPQVAAEEARTVYAGPVDVARTGLVVEV